MTVRAPRHKVLHQHFGFTYLDENSRYGIAYAATHGYPWIDLDALPSRDGSVRNVHGPTIGRLSGYRDPAGVIGRRTRVDSLTDDQLDRLVSKRGRMPDMGPQIRRAATFGINVEMELKPSELWTTDMLIRLLRVAKFYDVDIWIKTLTTPGWRRRISLACNAVEQVGYGKTLLSHKGFRPVVLNRVQDHRIDYARGKFTIEGQR